MHDLAQCYSWLTPLVQIFVQCYSNVFHEPVASRRLKNDSLPDGESPWKEASCNELPFMTRDLARLGRSSDDLELRSTMYGFLIFIFTTTYIARSFLKKQSLKTKIMLRIACVIVVLARVCLAATPGKLVAPGVVEVELKDGQMANVSCPEFFQRGIKRFFQPQDIANLTTACLKGMSMGRSTIHGVCRWTICWFFIHRF